MRRVVMMLLLFFIVACEKEPKVTFENRDYYQAYDEIMYGSNSSKYNYLILEFKDGIVEFSEAYRDSSSPHRWTKKGFNTMGDISKNAHFPIKNKGTYKRVGDEIVINGLTATNYVDHCIEFIKAEIKGEQMGAVNIDVYYKTSGLPGGQALGKLNFIGKQY